jgi:hypothetical protein
MVAGLSSWQGLSPIFFFVAGLALDFPFQSGMRVGIRNR